MRTFIVSAVLAATAVAAYAHPGSAIAVGADGRVYFVDTGRGNFVIERDGRVTRLEGGAFHWFAFDPERKFARTSWPYISGAEFHSAGPLVTSSDYPAAIGGDGAFYYARATERLNLMRITPAGAESVYVTIPGPIRWLNGLARGPQNSLYYTENNAVRKIDRRRVVSTVANHVIVPRCFAIPGTDGIPDLRGLHVTDDGTVYVAASGCGALLKIDPRGGVTQILAMKPPWSPTAVAYHNGDLYVLEYLHTASDDRREWIPRVRKISRDGKQVMLTK